MKRLPYEFVAPVAEELMVQVITAPEWEAMFYLAQYFIFLTSCGWTDQDLDREMLRHIDAAWDSIIRNQNQIKRIRSILN